MVEFEFQPWKKVVVHELIKSSLQDFLSEHSLGVQEGGIGRPLLWTDGIVFEHGLFPDTEDIIKEKLQAKVHWGFLKYTFLEKYQSEFKVLGSIRIPVIDVSNNQTFKEMANWIKNNFEKNLSAR
jgi:hypothetical protein